jgi:hypothetical protein
MSEIEIVGDVLVYNEATDEIDVSGLQYLRTHYYKSTLKSKKVGWSLFPPPLI